jgi:vitamin B12 transporter
MKITIRLLAAVSILALVPGPTLAQLALDRQSFDRLGGEDPEDEEIIVTANRTARAKSQVGESVTVIGEEEIVNRQPSEVLDILRTVPGVTFSRNGGLGTVSGV